MPDTVDTQDENQRLGQRLGQLIAEAGFHQSIDGYAVDEENYISVKDLAEILQAAANELVSRQND